jgi:hypothetical protein
VNLRLLHEELVKHLYQVIEASAMTQHLNPRDMVATDLCALDRLFTQIKMCYQLLVEDKEA